MFCNISNSFPVVFPLNNEQLLRCRSCDVRLLSLFLKDVSISFSEAFSIIKRQSSADCVLYNQAHFAYVCKRRAHRNVQSNLLCNDFNTLTHTQNRYLDLTISIPIHLPDYIELNSLNYRFGAEQSTLNIIPSTICSHKDANGNIPQRKNVIRKQNNNNKNDFLLNDASMRVNQMSYRKIGVCQVVHETIDYTNRKIKMQKKTDTNRNGTHILRLIRRYSPFKQNL